MLFHGFDMPLFWLFLFFKERMQYTFVINIYSSLQEYKIDLVNDAGWSSAVHIMNILNIAADVLLLSV